MKLFLLFPALILSFCGDPNARSSQIVRQIEGAGSGDISALAPNEIEAWLLQHRDLALISQVAGRCQQLQTAAAAGWDLRTAEGRACSAAQAANLVSGTFTVDKRLY